MMKFLSSTDKKSLGKGDNVNLEIQVQRTAMLRFFSFCLVCLIN